MYNYTFFKLTGTNRLPPLKYSTEGVNKKFEWHGNICLPLHPIFALLPTLAVLLGE